MPDAQKGQSWLERIAMEPKDWLVVIFALLALACQWGMSQAHLMALDKAVEPVPQMRTDIEVVKTAILDIRDDLQDWKHSRREP